MIAFWHDHVGISEWLAHLVIIIFQDGIVIYLTLQLPVIHLFLFYSLRSRLICPCLEGS